MTPTVLEILNKTESYFEKAGVEKPRLDAEWLLAHVLKCGRLQLYLQFDRPLESEILDALRPLVKRRAQREPLQHLLGTMDFAGLTVKTDCRALVPRPETDDWISALIESAKENPPQAIIDLGTGSGVIALSLAQAFPEAKVVGVDQSSEALALAQENALSNGLVDRVEWRVSDWFSACGDECYDWIMSNPPYLTEEEWETAEPEVKTFDPREALVSANEGLADLLIILEASISHLKAGGFLMMETGIAQHGRLTVEAEQLGYTRSESITDLSGRPRVFKAWK